MRRDDLSMAGKPAFATQLWISRGRGAYGLGQVYLAGQAAKLVRTEVGSAPPVANRNPPSTQSAQSGAERRVFAAISCDLSLRLCALLC